MSWHHRFRRNTPCAIGCSALLLFALIGIAWPVILNSVTPRGFFGILADWPYRGSYLDAYFVGQEHLVLLDLHRNIIVYVVDGAHDEVVRGNVRRSRAQESLLLEIVLDDGRELILGVENHKVNVSSGDMATQISFRTEGATGRIVRLASDGEVRSWRVSSIRFSAILDELWHDANANNDSKVLRKLEPID